ncbi:snare associated Golgi protein-domain-containing protein [Cladorrhinum sp. PSN332]|nr:snare associated Golgi protein-domain-containing protein [Cladorrhinum sp. PSN332]
MGGDAIEMEPVGRRARGSAPEDTDYQPINWKRLFTRPKYLVMWFVLAILVVLTVIVTIKHDAVVQHLRPFAQNVRNLNAGWLIPIAILIVISFPPLFGHEIVALLCGVVYGLWIGFGIVAAGTFIGELGTWFAFKYMFFDKSTKLERTNLSYGALARITRDGGFWVVFLIRLSALPGHFTTAVFSTCGVKFWHFAVATFLSLIKQIFLVYLGVLLIEDRPDSSAKSVVFGIAFVITIVMAVYIVWKMRKIKKVLLEEQAERRRVGAAPRPDDQLNSNSTGGATQRDEQWLLENQSSGPRDYEALAQEELDIGTQMPRPASLKSLAGSGWTIESSNTPSTPSGNDLSGRPVQERQYV